MEGTAWFPFVIEWGTSLICGAPLGSTCDPTVCREKNITLNTVAFDSTT